MRRASRLIVCAALASACASRDGGGPDASPCSTGILGDTSQPIAMELRALDENGQDVAVADGGDVAMIFPPQGGRVIFVGVRATNLDGCGVQLTGALRDEATKQVRIDARTVNLNASGDGWGASRSAGATPVIADYSNVPVCPNQWASTDVFDHPFTLQVSLKDRAGRTATKTATVTPRCAEPDKRAECLCICRQGYQLGAPCGAPDAGGGD